MSSTADAVVCQAGTKDPFFECKISNTGTGAGSGGYRLSGGKKSMKKRKNRKLRMRKSSEI